MNRAPEANGLVADAVFLVVFVFVPVRHFFHAGVGVKVLAVFVLAQPVILVDSIGIEFDFLVLAASEDGAMLFNQFDVPIIRGWI